MSKIGKNPVVLPSGVTATLTDNTIEIKGPKGTLLQKIHDGIKVVIEEASVRLECDDVALWKYWGTMRALIANMVHGVTQGYTKTLQVIGVGFDASLQGNTINFKLGFSHLVHYPVPAGIEVKIDKDPKGNALITLNSHDKQLIGQTAAQIRSLKKPEPYKGKGIRFLGEVVKLKAGKAAKK